MLLGWGGGTVNTQSYDTRSPGLNLRPSVGVSHTALCQTEGTPVPKVPFLVIACATCTPTGRTIF